MNGIWVGRLKESDGHVVLTPHGTVTGRSVRRLAGNLPSSASSCGKDCGEEEVVRGVHTLIAGVVQVYHRLHVVEEEEKGRKVEQEVEREDQGEEIAHMNMSMEMG